MKTLAALTDPEYRRPAAPSRLHRWLNGYVQDERDMPFAYLLLQLSATILPLAGLLFVPGRRGAAWRRATRCWAPFALRGLLG